MQVKSPFTTTPARAATLRYASSQTNHALPTVYHYSFDYQWLRLPETPLITCHISDDTVLRLSNRYLVIEKSGRKTIIPVGQLKGLDMRRSKLLFPILVGGLFAPLSLVAAYHSVMQFSIGISLFFVSAFLFYYGWRGTYQLSVRFLNTSIQFFSDEPDKNFEDFILKMNNLLERNKKIVNFF